MTDDLFNGYMSRMRTAGEHDQEQILEDAEEAHYMDGAITHTQYLQIVRLYAELTGDHDILSRNNL